MSEGKWSGGIANRSWGRGRIFTATDEDRERGARLYAQLANTPFFHDVCGRMHALREHRECRDSA